MGTFEKIAVSVAILAILTLTFCAVTSELENIKHRQWMEQALCRQHHPRHHNTGEAV